MDFHINCFQISSLISTGKFVKQGKDYIIFPLDVSSQEQALKYVTMLKDDIGLFKVGLELFVSEGPAILKAIREITSAGIFLDLKLHDIPETFNYLLGLHVQTRRVYDDDGPACAEASAGRRRYLVYRGMIDHRQVVVIWRETEGWRKADLERDKKFVAEKKLTEGADEVFVNGDSFIPHAKALEPVFKARMFAPVEV
jgi:hypothetical protein